METVNLHKICELLEKGVDNPSIQDDQGKFSLPKWKKEVQAYTEPFLKVITRNLNETVIQQGDLWKTTEFKVVRKYQGKTTRIDSLQDGKWKLPKPFVIEARDNDMRPVEGFIKIGPSSAFAEGAYASSICWGLQWWGTEEKAKLAQQIFESLTPAGEFTVSMLKTANFGGTTAWLFNSINSKELIKKDMESIVEKIGSDFLKLSAIFYQKIDTFSIAAPTFPAEEDYYPTRNDLKKAIRLVWLETRKTGIRKSLVMAKLESELRRRNLTLKASWQNSVENKLEDWFG